SPAWAVPRTPCSGPKAATRLVFSLRASMAWVRSGRTPVGLVISPIRLPSSRSSCSVSSTSRPVLTLAAGAGVGAGASIAGGGFGAVGGADWLLGEQPLTKSRSRVRRARFFRMIRPPVEGLLEAVADGVEAWQADG